ncbi:hypothetical protein BGS_0789 [Beggiatoa sp. SS]|nr:hypothetical protein BGS_0789 [Beggiatoa sp. SS]
MVSQGSEILRVGSLKIFFLISRNCCVDQCIYFSLFFENYWIISSDTFRGVLLPYIGFHPTLSPPRLKTRSLR